MSTRRNELGRWLNRFARTASRCDHQVLSICSIAAVPFLAECEPFSLFLTRAKTFEESVKDVDSKLAKRDVQVHFGQPPIAG